MARQASPAAPASAWRIRPDKAVWREERCLFSCNTSPQTQRADDERCSSVSVLRRLFLSQSDI